MSSGGHRQRAYSRYRTSLSMEDPASGATAEHNPYLRRVIARHFPTDRNTNILEVACGSGAALRFMAAAGYTRLSGIDCSEEQVAVARAAGMDCVELGDMFDLLGATAAGSLDLLLAFDVLEHLTKDEVLRFLDEALRVLGSGGRLIVHTVNGESPFFGRIRYGDFTHESAFTQSSLRQLLRMVGFELATFHEDTPVIHGPTSLVRACLWFVVRTVWGLVVAAETGEVRGGIFSQNLLCVAERSGS